MVRSASEPTAMAPLRGKRSHVRAGPSLVARTSCESDVAPAGIEHLVHLARLGAEFAWRADRHDATSRTARSAAYVEVAVTTVPLLTRRSSGVTRASRDRH